MDSCRNRFVLDANVIIDFHVCNALDILFSLQAEYILTDYIDCKDPAIKELISRGAVIKSLDGNENKHLIELSQIHLALDLADIANIILSKKEKAILLTGDARLKSCAKNDFGIEVRGTLWILDQLIKNGVITKTHAHDLLKTMLGKNRRLPLEESNKRLREWKKNPD